MLTESEAATKWCPLVRFRSSDSGSGPAFNRQREWTQFPPELTPNVTALLCIGSNCMAWRWAPQQPAHAAVEGRKGYCGAFGEAK